MTRLNLAFALAAAVATPSIFADTPGRHPQYLHARSDLHSAQALLSVREEANVTHDMREAQREIAAAINEIDHAAVLDRKNLASHPRSDANLDRAGRLQRVMSLLRSARADIGREEDNPSARGWRNAAFRHIDAAMEFVRRAQAEKRMDRRRGY